MHARPNPQTDKHSILMEDDKVRVGASSMQGWRPTMEDAHAMFLTVPRLKDLHEEDGAFFAIFDGHCGHRAAQLCAANILHWVAGSESYRRGEYMKAIAEAYVSGDENLKKMLGSDESGCTGVVALMVQRTLYCGNAGDSRAILCRKGTALPLTSDHKPTLPVERTRIERSGSFVSANGRVNGVLALSRAFGDFSLKDESLPPSMQAVTVVPDVIQVPLQDDDEFLVMACDGLFEKLTSEEVVAFLRDRMITDGNDPALACEKLMTRCLGETPSGKGSDNMSVIVVVLKKSPDDCSVGPQGRTSGGVLGVSGPCSSDGHGVASSGGGAPGMSPLGSTTSSVTEVES